MYKHLNRKDVPSMVLNCYPAYRGQKFQLVETTSYLLRNYWDGGSRNYCKLLNLTNGEVLDPNNSTTNPFMRLANESFEIPHNFVVVEHQIFCGRDLGIVIHATPQNITKFLPSQDETVTLTDNELRCLQATKQYKASYGGVTRRQQINMNVENWETAKSGLIEKGLLSKNGALTIKGKNYA